MKIKLLPTMSSENPQEMTLEDFADKHDLTMMIGDRGFDSDVDRFYAYFDNTETQDGHMLRCEPGNGSTHNEAMCDYAKRISQKTLIVNVYQKQRQEIQTPIFTFNVNISFAK